MYPSHLVPLQLARSFPCLIVVIPVLPQTLPTCIRLFRAAAVLINLFFPCHVIERVDDDARPIDATPDSFRALADAILKWGKTYCGEGHARWWPVASGNFCFASDARCQDRYR